MTGLLCIAVLSALILLISYGLSMRWLLIRREPVLLPAEPVGGIRVLHITDIHNPSNYKTAFNFWDRIYGLDYDFCVITGDLTRSRISQLYPMEGVLRPLAEKTPVYFVEGNHDRHHYEEVRAFMDAVGICMLANERVSFQKGKTTLQIIGLRDIHYHKKRGYTEISPLFEKLPQGPRLVLMHQPEIVEKIPVDGNTLVLAGHTHGGQVRIPFAPTLVAPGQGLFPRYGNGWYTVGQGKLFVLKGIGTTKFPIRLFNRPEIAVIEIL